MPAVLDAKLLQHGVPCPPGILHRPALPLLSMLVGEEVVDLPLPCLRHEACQQLQCLVVGRHALRPSTLGRLGIQPDPANAEIDLLDPQAEDLRLAETHQPHQQRRVGNMGRCLRGVDDCREVLIGDRPRQVLGLGQTRDLRQLRQKWPAVTVTQVVRDAQRRTETDQVTVDR
ncbi:hypothetical protein TSH64_02445 [Azospirillum sp. TSH64]|nr:hypothetical protein TSH64_02445 [Azospirillum sp. TSH64]